MNILKIKKNKKEEVKEKKIEKKENIKKETEKNDAYKFLKAAHITEKAGDLTEKNQYIFKVYPKANKIKIKKIIEEVFNVKVISVNIINIPKKRRKLGKITGWRKGYKKAVVMIKKGQSIDLLPR